MIFLPGSAFLDGYIAETLGLKAIRADNLETCTGSPLPLESAKKLVSARAKQMQKAPAFSLLVSELLFAV